MLCLCCTGYPYGQGRLKRAQRTENLFYALGDIHGQQAQLDRALSLIEADGGSDKELFFVGDFVDRGPESKTVIQTLIDGQSAGKPWNCILGNHDLMFHQFVNTAKVEHAEILSNKTWLHHRLGGMMTLASYMEGTELDHPEWISWAHAKEHGLDPASPSLLNALSTAARQVIPSSHLNWIASLDLYGEARGGHVFVHAGINPTLPLADQTQSDLIWIRDGWLDHSGQLEAMFVHGHTALDFPQHHGNRINLDGGAGYGRPLVPAYFDGASWFTLDENGRTPLTSS